MCNTCVRTFFRLMPETYQGNFPAGHYGKESARNAVNWLDPGWKDLEDAFKGNHRSLAFESSKYRVGHGRRVSCSHKADTTE